MHMLRKCTSALDKESQKVGSYHIINNLKNLYPLRVSYL